MAIITSTGSYSTESATSTARPTTADKVASSVSGTSGNSTGAGDTENTPDSTLPVSPSSINASSLSSSGTKATLNVNLNVLNSYDQPTYFITFSILSDDVNNSQEIIVAQTGSTNLNIQSLVIDAAITMNSQTRNTLATSFEMKIYEPQGTNLPDLIIQSAQALNLKNYMNSPWKLSLKFQGYDPTSGLPNTSITNQDYTWLVSLNKLSTKVTENGSVHTITFIPTTNMAFADQYAKLHQPIVIPRSTTSTVGSALSDLVKKMNASVVRLYGFPFITYDIKQVAYKNPISGVAKPFDHKIYPSDASTQSQRSSNLQFSRGTSFMSIIEHIFASSPTAVSMTASASRTNDNSNTPNLDFLSTFHLVDSQVELGAWNPKINDYAKKITYIIVPYESVRIFTNIEQATQSTDSNMTQKKADYIIQNNFLSKIYDYIYTGDNTEVLKCDIDLNFQWVMTMDYSFGEIHYNQATTAQSFNATAAARSNGKTSDLSDTSLSHLAENTDISNSAAVVPTNSSSGSSSTARLNTSAKISSTSSSATYADDLATSTNTNSAFVVNPITIKQGGNHRSQVTSFSDSDWTKQRSVYGMLLEQLYDGGTAEEALINITITIRGDPYWLGDTSDPYSTSGSSTSTPTSSPASSAAIAGNANAISVVGSNGAAISSSDLLKINIDASSADFLQGETIFVLRFNLPQGYDENTGSANIIQSQMYTGFYRCTHCTHSFQEGQFTQELTATRLIGMDFSKLVNIITGDT